MVSITNINYGIKESIVGIEIIIPLKLLIFDGNVNVRDLCIHELLIMLINTILNHNVHVEMVLPHVRMFLLGM